jgi:hypothetical protein
VPIGKCPNPVAHILFDWSNVFDRTRAIFFFACGHPRNDAIDLIGREPACAKRFDPARQFFHGDFHADHFLVLRKLFFLHGYLLLQVF